MNERSAWSGSKLENNAHVEYISSYSHPLVEGRLRDPLGILGHAPKEVKAVGVSRRDPGGCCRCRRPSLFRSVEGGGVAAT